MSHLLALPEELIFTIVDMLSCDRKALYNLCLVGNHVLLAITRPVIWREVTFHVDMESNEHSSLFLSLFADQERARSVLAIRLTFSGSYDYDLSIIGLLQEFLKRLTNLKHAYLGFFELMDRASSSDDEDNEDHKEEDTPSLLKVVLQSLVPLESVQVDGYDSSVVRVEAPTEFPQMKRLVLGYCSPSVINTWAGACNLEVIELGGGDGEMYYEENVGTHPARWFGGYDGDTIGTHNLLNEGLLRGGHYNHLKRLLIASDMGGDTIDIENMVRFFELNPNSFPALEELVLGFVFTVAEYQVILDSVASPRLKRLMMRYDRVSGNQAQLETLFVQSPCSWEKLTSLEELWFPMTDEFVILQPALSKLKNLTHLYFMEIDRDTHEVQELSTIMEEVTKQLTARLPRLEEIWWENLVSLEVRRCQRGRVSSVTVRQDHELPEWQLFSKNKWLDLSNLQLRF